MKLLDPRVWVSKACALPSWLHLLDVSLPPSCWAAPLYLPWVLEALATASDVLLASAPLSACARTGPWDGTVASAQTVPAGKLGDCSLAGFPHKGSVGGVDTDMQKLIMLSSYQHERYGGRHSSEDVPTAFCLHLPHGVRCWLLPQGSFAPRSSPGPHQNRVYFFLSLPCTSCVGGLGSYPLCRELGVAGRSSVPGVPPRTCHELLCLCPPGDSGFDFANWPNKRATKQLAAQASLLPCHLVKMGCRPTFNCFTCPQLSWHCQGLVGDVQHTVLAWAEPPSARSCEQHCAACWGRYRLCRGSGGLFNDASCSGQGSFVRCDSPAA